MFSSTTAGDTSLRFAAALGSDELLGMLATMATIRHFERRTAQSYQQAKIGGFCHLCSGQEAVSAGSITALRPDDPIITAYRDHGHAIARGMPPKVVMAEMFGKVSGCSKGKGGSMHLFDKAHHFFGGHAIVGGQCPLAIGLAFAIAYLKEEKVVVCYLGDGALNQGAFHESMNLAAIWKLPIIFVCENNLYSMGTHIARGTSMANDLSKKAQAYDMRSARCDGLDVLAVYDCFKDQSDRVRAGEGPVFIDVRTYRYAGHSMSDPQKYRTKEEVAEYQDRDCIDRFVNYLTDQGLASQQQIDQINKSARDLAHEAVAFAIASPEPDTDEMYTDVYANPFPPFKKGNSPEMLDNP